MLVPVQEQYGRGRPQSLDKSAARSANFVGQTHAADVRDPNTSF